MDRRASMAGDGNLQLYQPLTLQTLPQNGGHQQQQQHNNHQHPSLHHGYRQHASYAEHAEHNMQHHNTLQPPPEYLGSTRQMLGMPPVSRSSVSYLSGGGAYGGGGGMTHSFTSSAAGPATLSPNAFHGSNGAGSHSIYSPSHRLASGGQAAAAAQDGYYASGQS